MALPLWQRGQRASLGTRVPQHVSVESVSISSDGSYVAVGTEGGPKPNVGGSVYLFGHEGNLLWVYHHEVEPHPPV
jgi:hypothetical protein